MSSRQSHFRVVVVETEHGYSAPYDERIICNFWHPTKQDFVTEKFLAIELEISTPE